MSDGMRAFFNKIVRGAIFMVLPVFCGCQRMTSICFEPTTEPSDVGVVYPGERYGHNFYYELAEEDIKRGKVVIPELRLERDGYLPYTFPSTEIRLSRRRGVQTYDSSLLKFVKWDCWSDGSLCTARYTNAKVIVLKKDPNY